MEAEYEYIPIEKDLIPYRFDILINGKTFTLSVGYNAEHDFFTVDLFKGDNPVVYGEKVVYGKRLFDCSLYADVPDVLIIPYDLARTETRVTWDNLNETVFLWIIYG